MKTVSSIPLPNAAADARTSPPAIFSVSRRARMARAACRLVRRALLSMALSGATLAPLSLVQAAPSGVVNAAASSGASVAVAAAASGSSAPIPAALAGTPGVPAVAAPPIALPDFTPLVDKVGPAVVNIRTTERVGIARAGAAPRGGGAGSGEDGEMADFFRRFFGIPLPPALLPDNRRRSPEAPGAPSDTERDNGLGSGFILSSDGYVMTNAHVVEGADAIYVTLTDRREFKARLIGVDKPTDVAVVKIDASKLPAVVIGDSEKVRVGEWVLAIGSPFGLENTVTAGIVSAKSRYTGEYLPFIQTDVAVNPGNSGGPLINMRGEVIGINSQIYSRTGGFMGISFSIPIDEAMRVANQLKTTGVVTRGRIGVQIGPVTGDVAESLGLPYSEGALVSSVIAGGPAEKAGVLPGDIILQYDGHAINQFGDLPRLVGGARPGTQAPLVVYRKGQSKTLVVTIAQQASDKAAPAAATQADPAAPARPRNPLGLTVGDLTPDQARALGNRPGVQVLASEGPSRGAGLLKGDLILRVGNTDVASAREFDAVVSRLGGRPLVPLLVQRGDATLFVAVRPRAGAK
ncbi:DegQ family serine endoprotease [Robbsia sp. Bb-Pol-6]|uniref:Probable periplasmic serine endoprotease DegP-like n=1 Tax=Robbsia betulipollinis TaxID=2981849 RepID=A0ABT3ZRI3_9BURK|nr:DegQ family serine endoprotease [Robbsia betulipollinis]MCY0388550.1 DegQ family serine endoprotease [Robbsia betulipollinis]